MGDMKWRFPCSNHGQAKGISTGDSEAFKGKPYEAFAREILQNSIDARDSDELPVKVEFNVFELDSKNVPGLADLKNAFRRCKEYWAHSDKYVKEYEEMEEILNKESIKCLRISDFNTTGLIGVESSSPKNNQFLALTKSTGVSEKSSENAGGSKGVGKNAAFLMSNLRTVFYSTRCKKNVDGVEGEYIGSIGVSNLISGWVNDEDVPNRDYTQGTGYYAEDDINQSIKQLTNLDKLFNERSNEYGTDIYILGFREEDDWEKDVILSTLNSFMVSILRGQLEIIVNGNLINNNTVENFVYNENIIDKKNAPNIISQYRLLRGDNVSTYDIETELGNCSLLILPFSGNEEKNATNKCAMIRYPYMKIKDLTISELFHVSAICIIENNELGKRLREIENMKHDDWEPKRLKNVAEQKGMRQIIKSIQEQIQECVKDCLKLGEIEPLDPYGAGDFLPDEDIGDATASSKTSYTPDENVTISKIKVNKNVERNAQQEAEDGQGLVPDIGSVDDDIDGEIPHPTGQNEGSGGSPHGESEFGGEKQGESVILKREKLAGVRYKVIALNKTGKLKIIFMSPIDKDNCFLNISLLDDSNSSIPLEITSMKCNGVDIKCPDTKEYGPFAIGTNKKIILEVQTSGQGYFASEVKVICK